MCVAQAMKLRSVDTGVFCVRDLLKDGGINGVVSRALLATLVVPNFEEFGESIVAMLTQAQVGPGRCIVCVCARARKCPRLGCVRRVHFPQLLSSPAACERCVSRLTALPPPPSHTHAFSPPPLSQGGSPTAPYDSPTGSATPIWGGSRSAQDFCVAVCTVDGQQMAVGNKAGKFPLMETVMPLMYAIALKDCGIAETTEVCLWPLLPLHPPCATACLRDCRCPYRARV